MRSFTSIILLSGLYGCFGTGKDLAEKDLDIREPRKGTSVVDDEKYDPVVYGNPNEKVVHLPVEAFFSVPKDYFVEAPSDKERQELEKNVAELSTAKDLDKILIKARSQIGLGLIREGMDNYRHYIRYRPTDSLAALEFAMAYLRMGQVDETLAILYKTKDELNNQKNPKEQSIFVYRYVLALCYLEKAKLQNARDILAELLLKDKSFIPGYAALAASYLSQEKIDLAEFIVKRGLDRAAEDASLFNLLGVIALKRLDFGGARKHFDKALTLNKNYVPTILNLAQLDLNAKQYTAAKQHLFIASKLAPFNPRVFNLQGLLELRQKDYSRAKLSFTRAIELAPNDPYARFNLAVLYYEGLNQPGQALRLFHEVVAVAQNDPNLSAEAKSYIVDIKG